MTALALTLVLLSAVAHAGWNFIAKRAAGGPVFNWLFDVLSVIVCLPLGIAQIVLQPTQLGPLEATFIVGSGVLHLTYFLPVSYVAPAREIGILLGAAMGSRWLAEGDAQRRLAGAAAMVIGVVALAAG